MCDIFQFHLEKIIGVEGGGGGVDFIDKALWRNRDLLDGPSCVCICSTLPIWEKNKNHCLETYVNDMWLLEIS